MHFFVLLCFLRLVVLATDECFVYRRSGANCLTLLHAIGTGRHVSYCTPVFCSQRKDVSDRVSERVTIRQCRNFSKKSNGISSRSAEFSCLLVHWIIELLVCSFGLHHH